MKSLKNNIVSASFGTLLSKLFGFARQVLIAATFGVGITYDAYNYAYIIPGFLVIIIGGINGPLHNAIVTVLTPLNSIKASQILKKVSFKITFILLIIGLVVYLNAFQLISILGPNLNIEIKEIAAHQLRILSPCIPLSGFIGLSFGALNSKNKFFISSLSPSVISLVTIIFISLNWLASFQKESSNIENNFELLALATLTGTLIQFTIQIFEIFKIGLFNGKIIWGNFFEEEQRIFRLIIPASLASGLGQINVFIDMFFVSGFRGAASGLAYGNFLIQAPLGVLSNALILPLLPRFSKLVSNKETQKLQASLISGIEYCLLATFFFTGIFISFNQQIVELIFQRGFFSTEATSTVRKILIAYSVGMPFYLLRDFLIRTYYCIERAKLPFKLSILGIVLNILFDWILIGAPITSLGNLLPYNFGVVGIVISTGLVNLIICLILSNSLKDNNIQIPNIFLLKKVIFIIISCGISSSISSSLINNSYNSQSYLIFKFLYLLLGSAIFFMIYFVLTKLLNVNRINFDLLKS
tara:strand:- start:7784 stop:9367 length:1584 start_codon:yes stop_codon:yes gene_type:complete